MRRLEQSSSLLVPTMTLFLRHASLRIVNQSSVPTLIKRVQRGDSDDGIGSSQADTLARNAQTWMNYISKHGAAIYKAHVGELSKAIADERNAKFVEVCLQALAAVANLDKKLTPSDKSVVL